MEVSKYIKTVTAKTPEDIDEKVNELIEEYTREGYYCASIIISHPFKDKGMFTVSIIFTWGGEHRSYRR